MSEQGKRQVLPTNVRPTHYTLTFTPDFVKFTFVGTEVVNININESTSSITLHSKEIDIKSAKLVSSELKTAQSFEASKISYDAQKETVTLTFPQELASGTTASLHVEFTGILNDKMSGFYKSSYKDKDGNTRYMAATQFEATEARQAFPSWDEPAIKATFDIILIVPSDMTALSNMNVIGETQHGDGKKEVKFAKTPIMSTYLVAFIVGDLGYVETSTTGTHNGNPVLVRVYAPKGRENHGEFSLNVAAQVLEYFAEVFDIPYPLPKCDMVAVPDFEFGAMENWGLITYRMTTILYDPKASDAKFKERVAYTVSHELAHQWFGNLVTMEWWDHLWLNEGFATWVGYLAVDKIFPDWDIWTKFINEGLQQGLELDSLRSSHPIEVPVNDPSEIHQIFDAISYYKGASVIRMLSAYLGEDVFLSGVRRYLKRHKFSNASTGDLWKALTEESGVDVSLFMTGWTRVVGYPVLTVEEPAPGTLKIRQCRFLSSEIINPEEDNTTWWVPLGIDLGSDTPSDLKSTVLTQKETTLKLPPRESDFYVLNARKAGVFRVNYTPERLSKLGQAAKLGSLDISDRVGIMGDAGALAISGHGKTSGLLSFIKEFGDEDKFIVWCEIDSRLTRVLDAWFEQPAIQKGLNAFSRQLASKLVAKLGWEYSESEDYLTSRLRTLVIKIAGSAGDPDVIKEAHRRFNLFTKQNDESALHPNVRGTVYEIVLSHGGGKEEFEAILKIYREAKTDDQKVVALGGLGFAQGDMIQRALQFSLCDEVRDQDVIYILLNLKKNRNSRKPLWDFFKNNWNLFNERFGKSALLFGRMVDYCFGSLSSDDDIADIEKFFANKDCKVFERNYRQSLERVRTNAAWVKRDSKDIEDWLKANGFLK